MLSLPPSLVPRSVPLTRVPPPRRAGRSALFAMLGAWGVLGLAIAFENQLAGEFAKADAWRGVLFRVLLGLSGCLALIGFVPAFSGLRRARSESFAALVLGIGWLVV